MYLCPLSFEQLDKRICHRSLGGTNKLRLSAVIEGDEDFDSSQIMMFVNVCIGAAQLTFFEVFLCRVDSLGAGYSTWSIYVETSLR